MVKLYNVRFQMELCVGGDIWRLHGNCENHPEFPDGHLISPSTPIDFNETFLTFRTSSGKQYQIISFDGKRSEIIREIRNCIKKEGYEIH